MEIEQWLLLFDSLTYSVSNSVLTTFSRMFNRCLDREGRYFVAAHCIAPAKGLKLLQTTAESFDPRVNADCNLSH